MKIVNKILLGLSLFLCLLWPLFFIRMAFYDNPESKNAVNTFIDKQFTLLAYPWGFILALIWLSLIYGEKMWESKVLTFLLIAPLLHIIFVELIF